MRRRRAGDSQHAHLALAESKPQAVAEGAWDPVKKASARGQQRPGDTDTSPPTNLRQKSQTSWARVRDAGLPNIQAAESAQPSQPERKAGAPSKGVWPRVKQMSLRRPQKPGMPQSSPGDVAAPSQGPWKRVVTLAKRGETPSDSRMLDIRASSQSTLSRLQPQTPGSPSPQVSPQPTAKGRNVLWMFADNDFTPAQDEGQPNGQATPVELSPVGSTAAEETDGPQLDATRSISSKGDTRKKSTKVTMWGNALWRRTTDSSGGIASSLSSVSMSDPGVDRTQLEHFGQPNGHSEAKRLLNIDEVTGEQSVRIHGAYSDTSSNSSSSGSSRSGDYGQIPSSRNINLAHARLSWTACSFGPQGASASLKFFLERAQTDKQSNQQDTYRSEVSVEKAAHQDSVDSTEEMHVEPTLHGVGKKIPTPVLPDVIDPQLQQVLLSVTGTVLLDSAHFQEPTDSRRSSSHSTEPASISSDTGTTRMVLEACAVALKAVNSASCPVRGALKAIEEATERKNAGGEGPTGTICSARKVTIAHHKMTLTHAKACIQLIGSDLIKLQRAVSWQSETCRQAWMLCRTVSDRKGFTAHTIHLSESSPRCWKLRKAQAKTWKAVGTGIRQKKRQSAALQ